MWCWLGFYSWNAPRWRMGGPSVQETYPCNIYTRYYCPVSHNSQHHHIIFCLMSLCCLHCAAKKYWQSFECHHCGRRCFGSPQQTYHLWNYQECKPSIAEYIFDYYYVFCMTWRILHICLCLFSWSPRSSDLTHVPLFWVMCREEEHLQPLTESWFDSDFESIFLLI